MLVRGDDLLQISLLVPQELQRVTFAVAHFGWSALGRVFRVVSLGEHD